MKRTIAFITVNNPQNQTIRSGVPYSIYKQLSKYYNVVWIKPEVKGFRSIIIDFIAKIFEFIIRSIGFESIHNPLRSRARALTTQKKIDSIQYDAIFALNTEEFAFLKTDKPIFYRNDAIVQSMINYYYFNLPSLIRDWAFRLENRALANVNTFFAPSQWVIDEINRWKSPIPIENIRMIESGANLKIEDIKFSRREYGIDKMLRMIFVGYDVKRKGIDVAFETLCILNQKYNIETTLTIIGGIPEASILNHPKVKYVGILNKNTSQDFKRFYEEFSKANLFIFPTKAECHGIVNCEAAAYALPIYSYDTGGVSSYVKSGINGEALPLSASGEDFALSIYNSLREGRLSQYSIASRLLYENLFNWDVWGLKVKDCIDSVIG